MPRVPEAAPVDRRAVWVEVIALYLGTAAVIRAIKALVDGGVLGDDWLVLVALVFLYAPAVATRWRGWSAPEEVLHPEPFGAAVREALRWLLRLILWIYPVFLIGYHVLQTWGFHWFTTEILHLRHPYPRFEPRHALHGGAWVTLGLQVVYQIICVGWAEEYFYRGWMQTRLDTVFRADRFSVLGARFGWSLPVTALLFTAGHSLVTWQWWQPAIVFPALMFGWLRARTGTILAGAAFHAFANSVMIVLDHVYGLQLLDATTGGDLLDDLLHLFDFSRGRS